MRNELIVYMVDFFKNITTFVVSFNFTGLVWKFITLYNCILFLYYEIVYSMEINGNFLTIFWKSVAAE